MTAELSCHSVASYRGQICDTTQRVALTPGLTLSRALSLVLAPHVQRQQIAAPCKSHHLVDDWAGSLQRMREITEYLKAISRSNKKNKEDNKEAIMRMCVWPFNTILPGSFVVDAEVSACLNF